MNHPSCCSGMPTSSYLRIALAIAIALALTPLARSVSAQNKVGAPAQKPAVAAQKAAAPAQKKEAGPASKVIEAGGPGQPICGTPGTVCHTIPKLILQEPMDTSSKPWTGKVLPDGQPDLHGTFWRITDAGNGYLWNPQVNASSPGWQKYPQRASRIIDPADGLPPYLPWAKKLQEGMEAGFADPKVPEYLDPQGQCLSGMPKLNYYVSEYIIVQTPQTIAFVWGEYHQYRVIPLDGSAHIGPKAKLWMGDSRGHWDGNTLVVDETNLNGKSRMNIYGDFFSPNAHLTERFIYLSTDRMIYEVTVDDPTVYTRPYTMRVKFHVRVPNETELWETDCKENRDYRPSGRGEEVLDLVNKKK